MIGIAIDHCPEERGENEESADHAKDDGGVGEEEDFDENEGNAEHEKYDCFPSRQAGQIMTEEKENETNSRRRRPATSRPEF